MDNSLQEIAGSFTFLGMKNKLLSIFALALLPASLAVPQVAVADPNCIGTECEITFLYTGTEQTFTPPSNAANMRFEVYGAAGGRGGAGGVVTGTLTQIPETLYVYVGGAGSMGNGVQGGYNGGGAAGGDSDTEGAGGGASDIRIGNSLESRIIVAGGGGGGGGEAGGNGGHGGNLSAAHGGSGQASGGGGANQTSGGFAGVSNGGYQAAEVGTLGQGGAGARSTFAGGGGGGGGYYGGGGGGADDNTCCSDGGGGGGGSSFADDNYTTNVAHMAGVSWGHGWVVLRYSLLPDITYLELVQATNSRIAFSIEGSESLSTLSQDELVVSGEGCYISYYTTDGILGYGSIHGCESGEVSLTVPANTFGQSSNGPAQSVTASTTFDATGPELSINSEGLVSSNSDIAIPYLINESQLTADDFAFEGCQQLAISEAEIVLSGCEEGVGTLTLLPMTLIDIWQNRSPEAAITFSFTIDMTGPQASWSEIGVSGTNPYSYSASLDFGEPVSLSNMAIAFASTDGCLDHVDVQPSQVLVSASCSHADLSWTITATAFDALGNSTEIASLSISHSNPAPAVVLPPPAPEVVYVPVIVEVPVPEVPTTPPASELPEVSEPVTQSPVTESEAVYEEPTSSSDQAILVTIPAELVLQVPAQTQVNTEVVETWELKVVEDESSVDEVAESELAVTTEPVSTETVAPLAQPVLNEETTEPFEQPGFPWLPVLLVLGLGVLGFGAWRFSGR